MLCAQRSVVRWSRVTSGACLKVAYQSSTCCWSMRRSRSIIQQSFSTVTSPPLSRITISLFSQRSVLPPLATWVILKSVFPAAVRWFFCLGLYVKFVVGNRHDSVIVDEVCLSYCFEHCCCSQTKASILLPLNKVLKSRIVRPKLEVWPLCRLVQLVSSTCWFFV